MRLPKLGMCTAAVAFSLAAGSVAAVPAMAAAGTATVTVVHGIPNTPVDVYANGKKILSGFAFKTVTSPLSLPAGSYAIAVRKAGAAAGSAPILAATEHVDSAASGPGALFRLQQVRLGAAVTVTAGGRDWPYIVRAVRAYAKAGLPDAAVFGQHVTPRLVIITCGGPFDTATGHYLDNIVVYAIPA